jgi:phosphoglycolate phosphatase-like HAD superfamily hydrolase
MKAAWKRSAQYEAANHADMVIDDLEELLAIVLP